MEENEINFDECLMEGDYLQSDASLFYFQIMIGISSLKDTVTFLRKKNAVFFSSIPKFLYFFTVVFLMKKL